MEVISRKSMLLLNIYLVSSLCQNQTQLRNMVEEEEIQSYPREGKNLLIGAEIFRGCEGSVEIRHAGSKQVIHKHIKESRVLSLRKDEKWEIRQIGNCCHNLHTKRKCLGYFYRISNQWMTISPRWNELTLVRVEPGPSLTCRSVSRRQSRLGCPQAVNQPLKIPANNTTQNPLKIPANNTTKNPLKIPANNTTKNPLKTPANNTTQNPLKIPANNTRKNPLNIPANNTRKNPLKIPANNTTKNHLKIPANNTTQNPLKILGSNTTQNPPKSSEQLLTTLGTFPEMTTVKAASEKITNILDETTNDTAIPVSPNSQMLKVTTSNTMIPISKATTTTPITSMLTSKITNVTSTPISSSSTTTTLTSTPLITSSSSNISSIPITAMSQKTIITTLPPLVSSEPTTMSTKMTTKSSTEGLAPSSSTNATTMTNKIPTTEGSIMTIFSTNGSIKECEGFVEIRNFQTKKIIKHQLLNSQVLSIHKGRDRVLQNLEVRKIGNCCFNLHTKEGCKGKFYRLKRSWTLISSSWEELTLVNIDPFEVDTKCKVMDKRQSRKNCPTHKSTKIKSSATTTTATETDTVTVTSSAKNRTLSTESTAEATKPLINMIVEWTQKTINLVSNIKLVRTI